MSCDYGHSGGAEQGCACRAADVLRSPLMSRLLAVLVLVLSATFASAAEPARRPNVVLIVADDLGGRDLGCYGSTFHKTPHLDRLAKAGARLTDFYAACPVC